MAMLFCFLPEQQQCIAALQCRARFAQMPEAVFAQQQNRRCVNCGQRLCWLIAVDDTVDI